MKVGRLNICLTLGRSGAPKQDQSIPPGAARIGRAGRAGLALAGLIALAACSGETGPGPGEIGFIPGFYGAIAADEPNAVLIGRDILTRGGSAADAAVAVAFAMSVTYPSAVSLGASGVCLVHDPGTGFSEAVEFVAPPALGPGAPRGDRPAAVPGLPRGMAALHARYGTLPWGQLVAPAERLARFGHRASRAFLRELTPVAGPLFADPGLRATFADDTGAPVGEGTLIAQTDLASVLGVIRAQGVGPVYAGGLARRLIAGYNAAGGSADPEVWRGYVARWRDTWTVPAGDDLLYVTPPPAAGGAAMADVWRRLGEADAPVGADVRALHYIGEVSRRAMAGRAAWLGDDWGASAEGPAVLRAAAAMPIDPTRATPTQTVAPGFRGTVETGEGTGFVAVDRQGMAVACALGLFHPFGTGRVAPGTGVIPAAAPGMGEGRVPVNLTAGVVANPNTFAFRAAIAAGGGAPGSVAAGQVLHRMLRGEVAPAAAQAQARAFQPGAPDVLFAETGAGGDLADRLGALGHRVQPVPAVGRVNVIWCPSGLPRQDANLIACDTAHDPRGAGLSVISER